MLPFRQFNLFSGEGSTFRATPCADRMLWRAFLQTSSFAALFRNSAIRDSLWAIDSFRTGIQVKLLPFQGFRAVITETSDARPKQREGNAVAGV